MPSMVIASSNSNSYREIDGDHMSPNPRSIYNPTTPLLKWARSL